MLFLPHLYKNITFIAKNLLTFLLKNSNIIRQSKKELPLADMAELADAHG